MNNWIPENAVPAYLVVPPQYANQVYVGLERQNGNNLRCFIVSSNRPNEAITEKQDGSSIVTSFGEDRWDIEVFFSVLGRDAAMAVERIRRLNVPVYVYPKVGGTVQYSVPLIRGLGTDPIAATLTDSFSLNSATKLYFPHAVSGRGHYFSEVADGVPLLPGVYTDNGVNSAFPLGRGYGMFKPQKNLLKMSGMNTIDHSAVYPADGWRTNSTGWGTTHGQGDSPWLPGEKTWWTTAINTRVLRSYKFDIVSNTKGMNFSCSYQADGTFKIELFDSAYNLLESHTGGWGEGRLQRTFATISGSKTNCTLLITMTSGTYMRIGHCQFINGGNVPVTEYLPYLSTTTEVQGELYNSGLRIDGDFSAAYQIEQRTSGQTDTAIATSGYYQPGWGDTTTPGSTIAFLERLLTTSQGDVELKVFYNVAVIEFALYSGGVRKAGATVMGHEKGDVYAWVLYTGRLGSSTARAGFKVVRLRDENSYSNSNPSIGFTYLNCLYIGCGSTAGNQCDGIIGGASVDAVPYSEASKIADRLGNREIADLFRRTAGRWYHLSDKSSYRQFTRQAYEGSYLLTEIRAI